MVSLSGCPDDDPVPSADASTGDTDIGGSSTGPGDGVDETAGSSGSTSSATAETDDDSSTSTGEPEPVPEGARFILREPIDGGEFIQLSMYEYADGEVLDPVLVTTNIPEGGGSMPGAYTDAVDGLLYCAFDDDQPGRDCYLVDLTTRPPGEPQRIEGDPISETSLLGTTTWQASLGAFTGVVVDSDGGPASITSIPYADGVVGEAEALVVEGPSEQIGTQIVIDPGGAWLGYRSSTDDGPTNAYALSLDGAGAPMLVSDLVDPIETAIPRAFVQGGLIYTVDDGTPGATEDSIWWVDLAGAMPGEPIRVDDPLSGLEIRRPQVAPDGSGLVYWVGDGLEGDIMHVDLSSGVPELPVLVSTPGAAQSLIVDYGWSPDSRWIVYQAAHEQPETHELYVADTSGGELGEPMRVNQGLTAGADIIWSQFDATSTWLYYVGAEGEMFPRIYRTPLTEAGPGTPQQISGEEGWSQGDIAVSHDGTMMAYTIDGDLRELYLVDISGDTPGTPTLISAPPTEGAEVSFGPRFSSDDSVVVYDESAAEFQGPRPSFLVDLETMEVHRMADDSSGVTAIPN
ncbi:MAG: hypothetical protein AAF799_32345 [Myxococcota bacterium]